MQSTPASLAMLIGNYASLDQKVPIVRAPRNLKGQVELSYGQNRLWFLDQIEGPSATYNMPLAFRLRGALNVDALRKAFLHIIERHETLRTVLKKNESHQAVGEICSVPPIDSLLRIIKLDHANCLDKETAIKQFIDEESSRPFNLADEIPIRAHLICLEQHDHVLSLVMHHHASDGLSLAILIHELSRAYADYCDGSSPDFMSLPFQYADWVVWQKNYFQINTSNEESLSAKVQRAKARLAELPDLLALETDYPRQSNRSKNAGNYTFKLSRDLTTKPKGIGWADARNVVYGHPDRLRNFVI
jgi:hypothetical protein